MFSAIFAAYSVLNHRRVAAKWRAVLFKPTHVAIETGWPARVDYNLWIDVALASARGVYPATYLLPSHLRAGMPRSWHWSGGIRRHGPQPEPVATQARSSPVLLYLVGVSRTACHPPRPGLAVGDEWPSRHQGLSRYRRTASASFFTVLALASTLSWGVAVHGVDLIESFHYRHAIQSRAGDAQHFPHRQASSSGVLVYTIGLSSALGLLLVVSVLATHRCSGGGISLGLNRPQPSRKWNPPGFFLHFTTGRTTPN